ncbi:hypothetical protein [Streptomyces melanogenes]|uniref:hypothetical protein n=1 Tax=Streptomyces melanogenes TaxID=67326 RepID=UPI003798C41A
MAAGAGCGCRGPILRAIGQHPLFFGYTAAQAYLPSGRLAIAVTATNGPEATGGHTAQVLTQRIAAALAPDHPIPDFG